jgi:hypothetical protein
MVSLAPGQSDSPSVKPKGRSLPRQTAGMALLLVPYHWFANIIRLREKSRMAFPAVLGVVTFVSLARAEFEVLTTRTASFAVSGIVNNVAFYLLSAYLYALLAARLTGKSLAQVSGIVAMGVFLGIFPPILDTLMLGTNTASYRYIKDGFSTFSWTLINPTHYSTGEAITLWAVVIVLVLYVFQVTRSLVRSLAALLLSYASIVFLALGPSSLTWSAFSDAAPFARSTWTAALSVLQLLLAQAAYLLLRPQVLARLWRRLPHAAPFVALTFLGGAVAEFFAPSGLSHVERMRFAAVAAILMLELCLIALVQNDAYDREKDGREATMVTREDAHFFTIVGVLIVLAISLVLPGLGLPMALFLCVSVLYSYDFYRSQRFFPANYKSEGVWGWSAFVLGGSAGLSVAQIRTTSSGFLLASLVVFGGWSVFNVFKDYKDIRADYKAKNQTLYVLALRRGADLSRLHRGLRTALVVLLGVPVLGLGFAGVSFTWLLLVTGLLGAMLYYVLGDAPLRRTVIRFLWLTASYVMALSSVVELELRRR